MIQNVSEYVCSKCGKDGIYREVTVSGWQDIEIGERNGKPAVLSTGSVETDRGLLDEEGYACSECCSSFASLADAVVPAEKRFECLDCHLWAYYRDSSPRCLDCGSENLRGVGVPAVHRQQVAA